MLSVVVSVVLGFVLTTVVGGWWATRLQDRSWERQNDLRQKEDAVKRAATTADELLRLLDKRLYRMRRLYWAAEAVAAGGKPKDLLDVRLDAYNDVLYEWNDRLNANLALVGSYFGSGARSYLYELYEQFRSVGGHLEDAVAGVRRGDDVLAGLRVIDPQFEGWSAGSLNHRVYLLGLAMMTQVREERVGQDAPEALAVPDLALGGPQS